MRRTIRWAGALVVALLWASSAVQAGETEYSQPAFERALAQRHTAVVAFVTDWCNTCSVQQPLLAELLGEPRFRHLTVFIADFDKEVELKKRLRVSQQSTLVVFKNGHEVARGTGQTRKDELARLLSKAL
jgi:thioredoxin-like negative regulator of GroEL